MDRQEQILKDRGIRLTWRRQAILEVFRAISGQHLSAEDVRYELESRKVRINLTTIYRNLELLAREGLLRQVEFSDGCHRYELDGGCHHHLHCTNCGRLVEFACGDLVDFERVLARETRFRIDRHQLEVYGLCPACR